ncbi:unnamed protein product, partial [Brassica oleracea]
MDCPMLSSSKGSNAPLSHFFNLSLLIMVFVCSVHYLHSSFMCSAHFVLLF